MLGILLSLVMVLAMLPATALAADGDVAVNADNFPDAKFLAEVKKLDAASDDILTKEELAAITSIECNKSGIKDLTGIEYFTALRSLDCKENSLAALDVSKNTELLTLNARKNQLTELDISKNTKLEELNCGHNNLTELDVSNNPELKSLVCTYNGLTALDVSNNLDLLDLEVYNNSLKTIDLGNCSKITDLEVDDNQLTEIDVSKLADLDYFDCYDNQLTEVDISKNTKLTEFDCENNELTELDVSKNTMLVRLYCSYNMIRDLDLSQNGELQYLYANSNYLLCLDLSSNEKIEDADFDFNGRIAADGMPVSELPGFDLERVSQPDGGSFEGGTVNFDDNSDFIYYDYELAPGFTKEFGMFRGAYITFKVSGGTWKDGSSKDIVIEKYFEGGKDARGTLSEDEIPTEMLAGEGFEGGAWDAEPDTEKNGIAGDVTYTYAFTAVPEKEPAPATGDDSHMVWLSVLGLSALACAAYVTIAKKRRNS